MKKTQFPHLTPAVIRMATIICSLMLFSAYIGYLFGANRLGFLPFQGVSSSLVINRESPHGTVDFSLFWDVWKRLEQKYIDKNKIDPQKMVWGAISGMTRSLDDQYTYFLPPQQNKTEKEILSGEFDGIGAQLGMKDKRIVVIAPLKGTPADRAGILAGDWIVKVNGKETFTWMVQEAVDAIRGPKGTTVTLSLIHEQDYTISDGTVTPSDVSVVRDTILVPSVELEVKQGVAVIKLSQFGDDTNKEWLVAMNKIKADPNIKAIVLDVRNNPGGYLLGAVYIGSEFLDGGKVVIQQYADGTRDVYKVDRRGLFLKMPMVVLINKGSASASEIVAGALKVRGRAKVIGETSFGKGTIQEAEDVGSGAGLHVTTAKWLLPDESWINGKGVIPDIEVVDNPDTRDVDEQLDRAIEVLKQ